MIKLELEVATLQPHQFEALQALLASLKEPFCIPTSEESDAE